MKVLLIAFFCLVFFQSELLEIHSAPIPQGKKLFRADELSKDKLLPDSALSISIRFLSQSEPLKKGWWIFSRDELKIEVTIKNNLDSSIYIDPPYSFPGDESLAFLMKKDGKDFSPKGIPRIVDSVPLRFLKIEPGADYVDTINVLAEEDYDFKSGERYELSAIYNSQWGAFVDDNGQRQPVWSGRIQSNSLEFKYQE